MASAYTAETLLTSIRNLGCVPSTGSLGSENADLLRHADEALDTYLLPTILTLREDYFLLRERRTIGSTPRLRLPTRAALNKLRHLFYINTSGDRTPLDDVALETLGSRATTGSGAPDGYYLEGNHVALVPDSGTYDGSLEFVFFQRPSSLVLSTAVRRITAVDTVAKTITTATAPPTTWTTTSLFDIYSPHSGAELRLWDNAITGIAGSIITFSAAIDGTVAGTFAPAIGDYVSLAGQAHLPALPAELHGILARAAALHFAESIADEKQAGIHSKLLDKYLAGLVKASEQRVEGMPILLGAQGILQETCGYFRVTTE